MTLFCLKVLKRQRHFCIFFCDKVLYTLMKFLYDSILWQCIKRTMTLLFNIILWQSIIYLSEWILWSEPLIFPQNTCVCGWKYNYYVCLCRIHWCQVVIPCQAGVRMWWVHIPCYSHLTPDRCTSTAPHLDVPGTVERETRQLWNAPRSIISKQAMVTTAVLFCKF